MTENGNNGAGMALAPIVDIETGEIVESEAEKILGMISQLSNLIEESGDIASTIALQNKAEAMQFLTRKIDLESDIKNKATINILAARRRLGELTIAMPTAQGQRLDLGTLFQDETKLSQLADEGLTKGDIYRNELLARLPKNRYDEFIEQKIAAGYEITIGAVTEYARNVLEGGGNGGKGRRKPKTNRAGDPTEPKAYDACQTPAYAVPPLLSYIDPTAVIWEPAEGEGLLAAELAKSARAVIASDILSGNNFFECEPDAPWDCIVTNPPFSIKYDWLERCYELGKPFALLLPVETIGAKTAQEMFKRYGLEVILLDQRIDFKMPGKGWKSSAQFPVAWFCYQLLDCQVTFASIDAGKKAFVERIASEGGEHASS